MSNLHKSSCFSHFSSASSPPSSTASTAAVPGPPVAAVPRPAVPTGSPTALKAMSGTLGTTATTPGPASGAARSSWTYTILRFALQPPCWTDPLVQDFSHSRAFKGRSQRKTRELPVPSQLQTAKCTWKLILCRALALSEYIIYRSNTSSFWQHKNNIWNSPNITTSVGSYLVV